MKHLLSRAALATLSLAYTCSAEPLTIDLTKPIDPPGVCPYGGGTAVNPQGHALTADTQSFLLDGKPWVPVAGEFHYSRYPRDEWRDELLKMKAGGINTVTTYVFWIHQEEEQGKFDWSGQRSLRDFLALCKALDLKAIVRMGPYAHGEARNGGLPDWVQNSHTKIRSNDPAFMALVKPLFEEEARQMQGLLWKDGGPVVGVQLDNEEPKSDYLLALKEMARSVGVDVPYYVITGWQGGVPEAGLLPVFGGYPDGFWGGNREGYRKESIFAESRAVHDLGAQLTTKNLKSTQLLKQFPYACVEIGPSMMSSYARRIKIDAEDAAELAMAKLGSGNNMPGYYMYQSGTNPEAKLSTLQEDHPNQMPVKSYDFHGPLNSYGQVGEIFHLLREQHLFLEDFGAQLARMPPFFPAKRPTDIKDLDTLRWDVRANGHSGFLFFSERETYALLPAHQDVQFELMLPGGRLLVPHEPTNLASGSYGFWPFNLNCDGVTLEYATAQPLCHLNEGDDSWYFFAAQEGVRADLSIVAADAAVSAYGEKRLDEGRVRLTVTPGTKRAASVKKSGGGTVNFVVLSADEAKQFYCIRSAGRDRAILSKAIVFLDGDQLRLQSSDRDALKLAIFPASTAHPATDSVFAPFELPAISPLAPIPVTITLQKPPGANATSLNGGAEATWEDATVYKVDVPLAPTDRRILISFHYAGDAARLYAGDRLIDDNFYNGDPFVVGLWRIPPAERANLRLKVLPYSDGLLKRLPSAAQKQVEQAKASGTLDCVTASPSEMFERSVPATASE